LNELETYVTAAQLDALIAAADSYLSSGRPLSDLNPVQAQRLKLLPPHWVVFDPRGSAQNGMVLMGKTKGAIVLGVTSSETAISRLASKYRPYAKVLEIFPLAPVVADPTEVSRWILLGEYDRSKLAPAAALARDRKAFDVTDR
jgi:hypothetical protein